MIRDAVAEYGKATPGLIQNAGGETPLTHVWPWDARAPVPFCFLLEAVDHGGDIRDHLLKRLASLPFWGSKEGRNLHGDGWKQRVTGILRASSGRACDYVDRIIRALWGALGRDEVTLYRVPAMVLPSLTSALADAVPHTYSIFKSIWPEAERFIQEMDVRLAPPSRIVTLASRLVLSDETAYEEKRPATPDVARFRRLVHGVDRDCKKFQTKLLEFFESGKAADVFRAARDLLTRNKRCNLPPVLAPILLGAPRM